MFHTHNWVRHEVKKVPAWTISAQMALKNSMVPFNILEKIYHGYEIITLKCSGCGDEKTIERIGA